MNDQMKFQVQELRPEVLAFALLMEQRLREKDEDKGQSWKDADIDNLQVCATAGVHRIANAIHVGANREAAMIAVDLANYSMMIADVGGVLDNAGGDGWFALDQVQQKSFRKYDLIEHLQRQQDFSLRTFGPGKRTAGLIDHIGKEIQEIAANPSDVTEWVDVVLLALDGAWRSGHLPEEICEAIRAKLERNMARNWPDWRTAEPDKAIEHIKSHG